MPIRTASWMIVVKLTNLVAKRARLLDAAQTSRKSSR